MRFDTFLFDLDGTLVDSAQDLAASVNLLRQELVLPPLPLSQVLGCIGDGATLLVTRTLPEGMFSTEHLSRFLAIYSNHLLDQTTIYPGILDFLEDHRHQKLAVVTNKPYQLSIDLLEGLGLFHLFDIVVGGESCARKKPHPDPILHVLDYLKADASTAVMIGDHHTDLQSGRSAGVKTCFCSYGIGRHDNVPFDFLAETPHALSRLFPGDSR